MPETHDDDWNRLTRYLAGAQSQAEAEATRAWIAEDAARAAAADEMSSAWHATAPAVHVAALRRAALVADTNDAVARLLSRLPVSTPVDTATASPRPGRRWWVAYGMAAAALLGVALPVALRTGGNDPASVTYKTGAAQRSSVYLPDGSRADLRASSTLRVLSPSHPSLLARLTSHRNGSESRTVELIGEAIFTVRHDASRPFRVLAGGAVAEDLGTVFGVRAYPGEEGVRIAVSEGAVAMHRRADVPNEAESHTPLTTLGAGDVATLDSAGNVAVVHNADVAAELAWMRDRLVFRTQRLGVVVQDLNRAFNARVVLADPMLGDQRVTLDMPERTLDATLNTIATLLDLEVRPSGDSTLLARPSRPAIPR